jgi:hypothetical protein
MLFRKYEKNSMQKMKITCILNGCALYHGSIREPRVTCKIPTARINVCAMIKRTTSVELIPNILSNDGNANRREIMII